MLGPIKAFWLVPALMVLACGSQVVPPSESPGEPASGSVDPAGASNPPPENAPVDTPPKPSGKRAPCTVGADQTCNADPAVSATWGRCTELGVCECKQGFQLNPGGYCEPVK